jgi:hypothetical protein
VVYRKVAVALSPILVFGIADIIGWLLRRTIWRHPEVEPRPGGKLAREEPAGRGGASRGTAIGQLQR